MKLSTRAQLAILRRKKSTAQLLTIFFVLFTVLLLGLSILAGVHRSQEALRKTFASSFQIKIEQSTFEAYAVPRDPPVEGMSATVYTGERINKNIVEKIASTEGVVKYNAVYQLTSVRSDELEIFPGFYANLIKDTNYFNDSSESEQKSFFARIHCPMYDVNLNSELAPEFQQGTFSLTEGRHITADDRNVVLLSEDLAEKNGLKVGDHYHVYYDEDMLEGLFPMQTPFEVELTVIGLFHINVEQIVSEHTVEDAIVENHIFVDNTTAEEYAACGGDPLNYLWATFYVEDPAELDTVMERARARDDINWEYFTLSVNESSYQSALEPLQSISTALWIAVAVVALAMAILLYLVLRMSMQGRVREIKLYQALGIGKKQIWAQFVLECVLIAVLAFVPAAAVSAVSADAVGNTLLTVSTENKEERRAYTEEEWRQAAQNGTTQQLLESEAALEMDITPEEIESGLPLLQMVGILLAVLVLTGGFLLYQLRDVLRAAAMLHY